MQMYVCKIIIIIDLNYFLVTNIYIIFVNYFFLLCIFFFYIKSRGLYLASAKKTKFIYIFVINKRVVVYILCELSLILYQGRIMKKIILPSSEKKFPLFFLPFTFLPIKQYYRVGVDIFLVQNRWVILRMFCYRSSTF